MASPETHVMGAAADVSGVGTITWANTSNALSNNASYATASLGATLVSHWLKLTTGSALFSIPGGATIDGIIVEFDKKGTAGGAGVCGDNAVRIVKGGTIGTTDRANVGTNWASSDTLVAHGSSSDLWGESWTPSDINASDFGCAISAKQNSGSAPVASIDYAQITVHYTAASGVKKSQVCII